MDSILYLEKTENTQLRYLGTTPESLHTNKPNIFELEQMLQEAVKCEAGLPNVYCSY